MCLERLFPDCVNALGDCDPCADGENSKEDGGEIQHPKNEEGEVTFDTGEKADFAFVAEGFCSRTCVADHKRAAEREDG